MRERAIVVSLRKTDCNKCARLFTNRGRGYWREDLGQHNVGTSTICTVTRVCKDILDLYLDLQVRICSKGMTNGAASQWTRDNHLCMNVRVKKRFFPFTRTNARPHYESHQILKRRVIRCAVWRWFVNHIIGRILSCIDDYRESTTMLPHSSFPCSTYIRHCKPRDDRVTVGSHLSLYKTKPRVDFWRERETDEKSAAD